MASIHRRLLLGTILWAMAVTVAGTFTLLAAFDQISKRRFDAEILERHRQIVVALERDGDASQIQLLELDPAYGRTYSGRYWQIQDSEGNIYTSQSLFDRILEAPQNLGQLQTFVTDGPRTQVRGVSQKISFDQEFTVLVAESVAGLQSERAEMRRNLALGFGLVGVMAVIAAYSLIGLVLAPLRRLRKDVTTRWETEEGLVPEEYPTEVAPLVADINDLVDRNRRIILHSRTQASDLAHSLKTPLAALRNEVDRFDQIAKEDSDAAMALDRIESQINRALAKSRAQGAANDVRLSTDLGRSLERLERLFGALRDYEHIRFGIQQGLSIHAAIDYQDFEEITGNLLENAANWCSETVQLTVEKSGAFVSVIIEDDGPGIPASQRQEVLKDGRRLDVQKPGSGLGLAIANDLATAYGGRLKLDTSVKLGGLKAILELPLSTTNRGPNS